MFFRLHANESDAIKLTSPNDVKPLDLSSHINNVIKQIEYKFKNEDYEKTSTYIKIIIPILGEYKSDYNNVYAVVCKKYIKFGWSRVNYYTQVNISLCDHPNLTIPNVEFKFYF